jgi:hypothetical protein
MLLPSERIEHAIYSLIASADPNEGLITGLTTLGRQVNSRDGTVLLGLLKDLLAENLSAKKCLSARDWRTYPDPTLSDDDFFRHGDFRLYLTAKGRRRYEGLMPKAKAQDRIGKVLELESTLFADAVNQMARKAHETDAQISLQYQGGFRKQKFLEARLMEIEELVRQRIKLRRNSLIHARDLASPEWMNDLRDEVMQMVKARSVNLKSLMPQGANTAVRLDYGNNLDEVQRLLELANSLLRELELERDIAQPLGKPLVFISCGQYTSQEKKLGADISDLIKEMTPCEGYFAENQNSLQGLSQHIFGALNRAAGFIAVMHYRGQIETPSGTHMRGSVWVEQEIAIAAFLAQAQDRDLPVLLYIQNGIEREGVRQQLRLKPVEFDTDVEVLANLKTQITTGAFKPLSHHLAPV